jgi:hypothetical protein
MNRLGDKRFRTRRAQVQRSMRPPRAVVRSAGRERPAEVPLAEDQHAVVRSVRTVNTNRSAKQFARGHRGGILITSIPASANTASNGP